MNLETAVEGMLRERSVLQQDDAIFSPTFISEHMQMLAQYTGSVEERLAELEAELEIHESQLFKKYRKAGDSINAATTKIKYDIGEQKAEVTKLKRYVASSWKVISAAQSRIKHLVAESNNQI